MEKKLTTLVKKVVNQSKLQQKKIYVIKRVNKLFHSLGILSRTNKALANSLRIQLNEVYVSKPTNKELWEQEN